MPSQVVMTALLKCPFGAAPASLIVIPRTTIVEGNFAANIMDFKPVVNIPPFGMCSSPTSPLVIAATAAKLGVFSPVPCMPVTTPWVPGAPTVLIDKMPALNNTSKCICAMGGVITVAMPGTVKTMIP